MTLDELKKKKEEFQGKMNSLLKEISDFEGKHNIIFEIKDRSDYIEILTLNGATGIKHLLKIDINLWL